jgi:hypothetical protein
VNLVAGSRGVRRSAGSVRSNAGKLVRRAVVRQPLVFILFLVLAARSEAFDGAGVTSD